jgi:hypothetical protein
VPSPSPVVERVTEFVMGATLAVSVLLTALKPLVPSDPVVVVITAFFLVRNEYVVPEKVKVNAVVCAFPTVSN